MTLDFEQELDRLRIDSLRMFYMVRDCVDKALRAVRLRDAALSQEVVDSDEAIDSLECQNEALGLRLLALKQPVARDLRLIVGSMRIASNLERMGDEAVNVAERNFDLLDRTEAIDVASLWRMGEMSLELIDKAARAFADTSPEQAQEVLACYDAATSQHMKVFRDLTAVMIREARMVERAVQLSFMSYSFKRICERCFNLAESVIFIAKGLDVKHAGIPPCA
jgi:phosphate transport system protein